jgi:rhodanese-related sulfurtransferase
MKRLLHHTRSLFYNSQLWSAGADIGKQELKELISKPAIRILDVRTREEHGSGFIPTATNIPGK